MTNLNFFKTLYEHCITGQIELRALPSGKRQFINLDTMSGIEVFCDINKQENMFFGVGLRNGGGTKEHITEIPGVWCDVDYKETSRGILIKKLKSFPFKPSFTVKTGGGVHFYWLFKEPCDKLDISKVEDVNGRIAISLGGDINSCDAARILRIPGTVNHKYQEKPVCEVVEINQYYYNLEDFLDLLPEVSKKSATPPRMVGCPRQCNG